MPTPGRPAPPIDSAEDESARASTSTVCGIAAELEALRARQALIERQVRRLDEANRTLDRHNQRLEAALTGEAHGWYQWEFGPGEFRVSPSCWAVLGYEQSSIAPSPRAWASLIHRKDYRALRRDIVHLLRGTTRDVDRELRVRAADGAWRWFHLTARVITSGANGVDRVMVGTYRDRSVHKEVESRMRQSEERFRRLAALSSDWYWEQDAEFRYTMREGHLGRDGGNHLVGAIGKRRWEQATPSISPERWAEHKRTVLDQRLPFSDFQYERIESDGTRSWVSISAEPMFDGEGEFKGYRGIGRNITAQKAAEAAMLRARLEAEAASRAKSQFLDNMSHEIRTPLNGIIGMAELALAGPLDAEQSDYIATIKESAGWLLRIVNDILDFSKLEAGRISLESTPFELCELIAAVVHFFGPQARAKGLRLDSWIDTELPARVMGDPTRLREILVNLVGNALKFTDKGSVHISLRRIAGEDARAAIEFAVSDTGIGIAADQQASVFEPFAQADASTTRRYGGTGLGLTVCSRLVHAMGGELSLQSEPGAGSTFRFRCDFEPASAPAPNGHCAMAVPLARSRIGSPLEVLLAEDNAVNQKLACKVLTRAGHAVTVAANGAEAIAALAARHFDVILMDVQMPVVSGLEAAAHIRRIEAQNAGSQRRIPIIAVTANAMDGDRERCLAAGMDDYVTKPVRFADLIGKIDAWVRVAASGR